MSTLLNAYPGEEIKIKGQGLILSGIKGSKDEGKIFAPFNSHSRRPVSIGQQQCSQLVNNQLRSAQYTAVHNVRPVVMAVSDSNINLSSAEKELLRWHQTLGHIAFKKVQHLMKSGVLVYSEATRQLHRFCMQGKNSKMCSLPICQTMSTECTRDGQTNGKG